MPKTRRRHPSRSRASSKSTTTATAAEPCPLPHLGVGFEQEVDAVFQRNHINLSQTSYNLEKQVVSDLHRAVNPHDVAPHDDFYAYINDHWIQTVDRAARDTYMNQVDNVRVVQDQTLRSLMKWTREMLDTPSKIPIEWPGVQVPTMGQRENMRAAWSSFSKPLPEALIREHATMWNDAMKKVLQTPVQKRRAMDAVDLAAAPTWRAMGQLNRLEFVSYGSPAVFHIAPNERDPTQTVCMLDVPQLTLLDPAMYLAPTMPPDASTTVSEAIETERRAQATLMREYRTYLTELFRLAFGADGAQEFQVDDVIQTEILLYEAMRAEPVLPPPLASMNHQEMYYSIHESRAQAWFGLDWSGFLHAMGAQGDVVDHFVTTDAAYLLALGDLVRRLPPMAWHAYFVYLYIRQLCRHCSRGAKLHFAFHGRVLRGQEVMVDADLRPAYGMIYCFPATMSRVYVAHQRDANVMRYVAHLFDDLRRVFVRMLKRNRWLHPRTRAEAIAKIQRLRLMLGSEEFRQPEAGLEADIESLVAMDAAPMAEFGFWCSTDAWWNLEMMSTWKCYYQLEHYASATHRKTRAIPPWRNLASIDWSATPPKLVGTQSFLVNAMYTPTSNAITVPLGYLQPPFVDLRDRGIEYNLAHIGFTLAHEMSHALDDLGSQYDAMGRLREWWTPRDVRRFRRIQQDIVLQYHAYMVRDGVPVEEMDVWTTVGEDMADISGLAICQEYLRDVQLRNKDVLPINSLSFRAFYIYYAMQSRQHIRRSAMSAQVKTNPHPLDRYRCNVPLSRSRIFRALYDVGPHHNMWWKNTHSVWSE